MSEHTKGLLRAAGQLPCVIDAANARRLVATWNACEGIPTETIERGAEHLGALHCVRDHDELIEALRAARDSVEIARYNAAWPQKDIHAARLRTIDELLAKHAPKVPA